MNDIDAVLNALPGSTKAIASLANLSVWKVRSVLRGLVADGVVSKRPQWHDQNSYTWIYRLVPKAVTRSKLEVLPIRKAKVGLRTMCQRAERWCDGVLQCWRD